MRHKISGFKLGRNSSHRKALAKNLLRAFFLEFDRKGYIVTTKTKAKFIQPKVEKMITMAKTKSLHNVRRAMAELGDREAVSKLFDQIGPYYVDRPGGYTRVLKMARPRLGDNAPRAYLGYVHDEDAAATPAVEKAATAG